MHYWNYFLRLGKYGVFLKFICQCVGHQVYVTGIVLLAWITIIDDDHFRFMVLK